MTTIYKYPLNMLDEQTIIIPENHKILCVHMQGQTPCMWAMVDPNKTNISLKILVYGTGTPIVDPEMLSYISSIQIGFFVWHIFTKEEKR